jgi:autotransporter-associated beta strand protein
LTVSGGSLIAHGGTILLLGATGSPNGNDGIVTVTNGDLTLSGGSMTTGSFDFSSGKGNVLIEDASVLTVTGQTLLGATTNAMTNNGGSLLTDTLSGPAAAILNISDPTGGTALTVGTHNGSSTFHGVIQDAAGGPGSLDKVGAGTLELTGSNTYSGTTMIVDGQIVVGNANALQNSTVDIWDDNRLDVTTHAINANLGGLAGYGNLNIGSQILTVGGNNESTTYSGELSGIGGSLIKTGTGALTLEGIGNFTGTTDIDAGQIIMKHFAALAFSTVSINTANGLDVTTHVSGANLGGLAGPGNLNIGSQNFVVGANSESTIYEGELSGVGGSLWKLGTGTLTLTGANTYSGGTIISSGTVAVAADGNLGNASAPLTFSGGVFSVLRYDAAFDLAASRSVSLEGGGGTFDTNGFDTTLAQAVAGTGGLTKTGAGTLTLTGANTYSGGTTINGGTLLANNISGSATGNGNVTVSSLGTLGGAGNVSGAVTVNSGGTVAPGASVGTLTVENVVFESGSTFDVELAGSGGVAGVDFDQLVVNNGATLGGTLNVSLVNPFTLSPGLSFEILDVGGSLSGTFSGLAEGGLVGNYGGTNLLITYAGGDGNDVTLLSATPGDFDLDNDVDGLDFLKWQRGGSPNPLSASDLSDWESYFGTVVPAIAAAVTVPEPSSVVLLLMCGLFALSSTRRVQ